MKGGNSERLCVSCRTYHKKNELIRIMRTEDGFLVDPGRKSHGRSVYVCRNRSCVERMLERKLLSKAFRTSVPESVLQSVREVTL